jgi:outer membrane protein TolC
MNHDKRIQKLQAAIKSTERESEALTESHRASAAALNRQIAASQERVAAAQAKVQKARAAFFDKHGYWP